MDWLSCKCAKFSLLCLKSIIFTYNSEIICNNIICNTFYKPSLTHLCLNFSETLLGNIQLYVNINVDT
jgi:hypothetical protein